MKKLIAVILWTAITVAVFVHVKHLQQITRRDMQMFDTGVMIGGRLALKLSKTTGGHHPASKYLLKEAHSELEKN